MNLYNTSFKIVSHNCDFSPEVRYKVIDYLIEKYGRDNTASVGTFGILKIKSAIQDVCRVFSIPPSEVIEITTKLEIDPEDEELELSETEVNNPALTAFLDKWSASLDKDLRFYINGVRGSIRQAGVHASGFLVSSISLADNIALMRSKKDIASAWQEGNMGRELSDIGYAKFDILGLASLNILINAQALIKERHGVDIVWDRDCDIEDAKVYKNVILKGDLAGIFQFEKSFVINMVKNIQPKTFEQFAAISAILRPGPLKMGMDKEFARRNRGLTLTDVTNLKSAERPWSEAEIPEIIRDIMAPTLGVLTYQEQVQLISTRIGGFTDYNSNKLRKDLTKGGKQYHSNPEVRESIDKHRDMFMANAVAHIGATAAKDMWDTMLSFAAYGFNKSHSICYTHISFYEAWLKHYYSIEFYVSLLNNTDPQKQKGDEIVMSRYLSELFRKGFVVHNVNINTSQHDFTIKEVSNTAEAKEIFFGFGWVKNLSANAITEIVNTRSLGGGFSDLNNLFDRLPDKTLNKKDIEALVWSGALDEFIDGEVLTRSQMLLFIFNVILKARGSKAKPYEQEELSNYGLIQKEIEYCNISMKEIYDFNKLKLAQTTEIDSISDLENMGTFICIAKVVAIETCETKKAKKEYIRIRLRDETGEISISVWPWELKEYKTIKEGTIIRGCVIRNEDGFISLKSFTQVKEQPLELKKRDNEIKLAEHAIAQEKKLVEKTKLEFATSEVKRLRHIFETVHRRKIITRPVKTENIKFMYEYSYPSYEVIMIYIPMDLALNVNQIIALKKHDYVFVVTGEKDYPVVISTVNTFLDNWKIRALEVGKRNPRLSSSAVSTTIELNKIISMSESEVLGILSEDTI